MRSSSPVRLLTTAFVATKNKGNTIKQKAQPFKLSLYLLVEMEGLEPSSKQGSHTLSTCLFLPSVFVMQQDQDHQLHPYPLKFHRQSEASVDYSRFYSTADQNASGRIAFWAMSRSPAWRGN